MSKLNYTEDFIKLHTNVLVWILRFNLTRKKCRKSEIRLSRIIENLLMKMKKKLLLLLKFGFYEMLYRKERDKEKKSIDLTKNNELLNK